MSAPRTNVEKQARRHRWSLIGMALGIILLMLLLAVWLVAGPKAENEAADTEPGTTTSEEMAAPEGAGEGGDTGAPATEGEDATREAPATE
ncbi:hypothetical protein [Pontibaca methylaminivorans]|uniref:hypothetical protein n=1 Tax=Pontibaca methylaminivorans TaxID=515897 RepID=UPI0009782E19|nr:hypothetical protein [Pontibaca methylaminivorans]